MRVVLLAAGRGTRISRYLSGNPKCTVDIGNQCLIQYTLDLFHSRGITDIAMVLGYSHQAIINCVNDNSVKYFYNPFYDVTNSIASAWFARDYLSQPEDTLIMNADVFLEDKLLDQVIASQLSPVLFADNRRKEEADYKFKYTDGVLEKYGKELEGDDITGEYVGIGKFSADFIPKFVEKMEDLVSQQQHGVWWENILYSMVGKENVLVEEIGDYFWAEVDYVEDYQRILDFRGYKGEPGAVVHK